MIRSVFLLVMGFAVGVLTMVTAQEWVDKPAPLAKRQRLYDVVICPPNWTHMIDQRYDDRNGRGEITRRTWIRKCA